MKFPYNLSENQISLLSPKDRKIYEYEHSVYYSIGAKNNAYKKFKKALMNRQGYYMNMINEDEEFNQMPLKEKRQMSKELAILEYKQVYKSVSSFIAPYCSGVMSKKQYDAIMEECSEEFGRLCVTDNLKHLNESGGTTPGHDLTFWIPGMDWLFNLSGSLLAGALAGITSLIVAGKDKIAAKLLERYMNKLVELTDCGVNKKKPWYTVFTGGSGGKNAADKSKACFRSIQECVERDMCVSVMVAAKSCGMFGDDPIEEMQNMNFSQGGLLGGSDSFKTLVADIVEQVSKSK